MHYDPRQRNHGLPHDPFNALVVPRPIGWISTLSPDGVVNLAPYSFFNAISSRPPFVMFSSSEPKDSRHNAETGGEFVVNLATYALREAMNASSAAMPADVSEPAAIGLEMAPSVSVKVPRVARSPAALECRYVKTVELPGADGKPLPAVIVIGEVTGIHIDDAIIVNGQVDLSLVRPLARLGYLDYTTVDEIFAIPRPA